MPPASKKRKPAFVIRLEKPGLRPWDVPARALWHIIIAIQRLIERTEPETTETGEPTEEPVPKPEAAIRLLDVVSGSAVYPVGAVEPDMAMRILRDMGTNLSHPTVAEWDGATLSSLDEISRAAKSIGCIVEIKSADKQGTVLARITPESYQEVAELAFVRGKSSVYGYLERVGGATQPHCGLRIPSQPTKMIICHVASEQIARELGPHVYEYVRLFGTVTWYRQGWRVKSVIVEGFEPTKTGPLREALHAIWEAGGKAWDAVDDPEALIRGMR